MVGVARPIVHAGRCPSGGQELTSPSGERRRYHGPPSRVSTPRAITAAPQARTAAATPAAGSTVGA